MIISFPRGSAWALTVDARGNVESFDADHDTHTDNIFEKLRRIPADVDLSSYYAYQSDHLRSPSHCIHPSWDYRFTRLGVDLRMTVRSLLWGCIPYKTYFRQLTSICDNHSRVLGKVRDDFKKSTRNHGTRVAGAISDQLLIEHYGDDKLLAVFERYAYCLQINEPADLDKRWVATMLTRVSTLSAQLSEQVEDLKAKYRKLRVNSDAADSEYTVVLDEWAARCALLTGKVVVAEAEAAKAKLKIGEKHVAMSRLEDTLAAYKSMHASLEAFFDDKCVSLQKSEAELDAMKRKVIVAQTEVVVLSSKFVEKESRLRRRIHKLKAKLTEKDLLDAVDNSSDSEDDTVKVEVKLESNDGSEQDAASQTETEGLNSAAPFKLGLKRSRGE